MLSSAWKTVIMTRTMSTTDAPEAEYPEYRPKVDVKKSSAGLGLFAGEDIETDQLIIEYTGERITADEADERGGRYLFAVTDDLVIDGTNRKYTARYINHSCAPNAEAEHEVTEDRIYIRALTKIPKGEEITFDYGSDYTGSDFIKKDGCKCRKCLSKKK